ncbi:MAG: CoA-binding protein [Planctomycetia bacterium]
MNQPQSRPPTVAILGASADPAKWSHRSLRAHLAHGYTVYPVNPGLSVVDDLPCYPSIEAVPTPLDRVSVYLRPAVGMTVIDAVAAKNPAEVYLNPGAESPELVARAQTLGLNVRQACSIVALDGERQPL